MYRTEGKLAVLEDNFRGEVLIAGDIHGDLEAFVEAKQVFEEKENAVVVFLGDYADRGENGLEVIEGVKEMLKTWPRRVVVLKGNHEDYHNGKPFFSPWTLGFEVEEKLKRSWQNFFPGFERSFLTTLHLAFLIPKIALCVHGGVSRRLDLSQLKSPEPTFETDVLWSDPGDADGEYPNPRGAGVLFGPNVSKEVCERIGVKFIVRGHEPAKASDGPVFEHQGRVVTTSCTSVYGGRPFLISMCPQEDPTPEDLKKNTIFL